MKTFEEIRDSCKQYYEDIIRQCKKEIEEGKCVSIEGNYLAIYCDNEYLKNIDDVTKQNIACEVNNFINTLKENFYSLMLKGKLPSDLFGYIEYCKNEGIDENGNYIGSYSGTIGNKMKQFGMTPSNLYEIISNPFDLINHEKYEETYDRITKFFNNQYKIDIPTRKELKDAELDFDNNYRNKEYSDKYHQLRKRNGEFAYKGYDIVPNAFYGEEYDRVIALMEKGIDVLGEHTDINTQSNTRTMGFTVPWILGLITGAVSVGIILLGIMLK